MSDIRMMIGREGLVMDPGESRTRKSLGSTRTSSVFVYCEVTVANTAASTHHSNNCCLATGCCPLLLCFLEMFVVNKERRRRRWRDGDTKEVRESDEVRERRSDRQLKSIIMLKTALTGHAPYLTPQTPSPIILPTPARTK